MGTRLKQPVLAAFLMLLAGSVLGGSMSAAAEPPLEATLYKNAGCQCCDAYAAYLNRQGFDITVVASSDLNAVKREYGVPPQLAACHTMPIGDYVVEGHVPADVLARLLRERPEIRGISLPGMPLGSPGMSGQKQGPFEIQIIGDGRPEIYEKW